MSDSVSQISFVSSSQRIFFSSLQQQRPSLKNNKSSLTCCSIHWVIYIVVVLGILITPTVSFSIKGNRQHLPLPSSSAKKNRFTTITSLYSTTSIMPATSKFTLKQFLNVPGLKALGLIFTDPVMIIPSIHIPTLHALDLDRLKAQGIECIVFDKDNTLSYCYAEEVHPSVVPVLQKAQRLFTPEAIAILSNSAGSCDDVNFEMAKKTEESMGIPVIRHEEKKPGCLDEVLEHFEGKLQKKIKPEQICVIGDRVMTDVVFGNIYNMKSVLVDPLTYKRDHPAALVIRFFEVHVLLPIIRFFLGRAGSSAYVKRSSSNNGDDKMK